jgi:hypothetical protein
VSGSEYKILDTRGKFTQAARGGRSVNDAEWTSGRVLLSNRRLVLASNDGKRTVPLSEVRGLDGRHDSSQAIASVSGYVTLRLSDEILLVAPPDADDFLDSLYRAFLDDRLVLVKHPAVAGGVVQDVTWQRARTKVGDDVLNVAVEDGTFVEVDRDDIGSVGVERREVEGEERPVVSVEHTDDGTSVKTHLSGAEHRCSVVETYLRQGEQRSQSNLDLSDEETEVLVALYSGVSPFEIPDFLGMPVDDVEAIYERLVETDVVEEVRVRREVALRARGRNIASEAMNDR